MSWKFSRRRAAIVVVAVLVAAAVPFVISSLPETTPRVKADGPGNGTPWVVTLGDSIMSGEGGRWAGNNRSAPSIDALGKAAYYDNANGTGEQIAGCHRSRSAEGHIGGEVKTLNLACSGAKTTTYTAGTGYFKPGIDFYDSGAGQMGQARMLQLFAADHNVRMVVLSIGANNLNIGSVVQSCIRAYVGSPAGTEQHCKDDPAVAGNFTEQNLAVVQSRIVGVMRNIRTAMRNAGYADGQWTLVLQNYGSMLPPSDELRYAEGSAERTSPGGCAFFDEDVDWFNNAFDAVNRTVRSAFSTAKIAGSVFLDLSGAFEDRRLCERGTSLLADVGLASWRETTAVDESEWITPMRLIGQVRPEEAAEGFHPNYWGQLAVRACLREVWNGGAPQGGRCVREGAGLVDGEPRMRLE